MPPRDGMDGPYTVSLRLAIPVACPFTIVRSARVNSVLGSLNQGSAQIGVEIQHKESLRSGQGRDRRILAVEDSECTHAQGLAEFEGSRSGS